MIPTDPWMGVALPRERRRDAAMNLPTAEGVAAILNAADRPFRALVALAAFAGMRLGETAALQVGDVDYLRGVVSVSRQVQRVSAGVVEIRAPKWESERQVFIPRALAELLAEHASRMTEVMKAADSLRADRGPTGSWPGTTPSTTR